MWEEGRRETEGERQKGRGGDGGNMDEKRRRFWERIEDKRVIGRR